jgi:TetR/AcrR family transcriptional regulator
MGDRTLESGSNPHGEPHGSETAAAGPSAGAQPPLAGGADPSARVPGRKERTRRSLLDVAGTLFANQGVESTTIEQIADAAQVSVGTVYAHFGSKEALAVALIDESMDLMEEYLAEARSTGTPLERVIQAGDAYFRFALARPVVTRFSTMRGMQPHEAGHRDQVNSAFQKRIQRILLTIAGDLKLAMDEGQIARRPIDEAMVFVWGAWHGVTGLVIRQDAMAVPPELAVRALAFGREMLQRGLTADLPLASGDEPAPPAAD